MGNGALAIGPKLPRDSTERKSDPRQPTNVLQCDQFDFRNLRVFPVERVKRRLVADIVGYPPNFSVHVIVEVARDVKPVAAPILSLRSPS
jgi:hypothetical protein